MTRPEKIEEKIAKATYEATATVGRVLPWERSTQKEAFRQRTRAALAALSVEDLLGLAFTEEEREALEYAAHSLADCVERLDSQQPSTRRGRLGEREAGGNG